MSMALVTIEEAELKAMKQELTTLRKTALYQRLLDFHANIATDRKYTRKDLGF